MSHNRGRRTMNRGTPGEALFETEASIREKVANELDRLAREFERDYPYRTALAFAARFARGDDCPVGPITPGWFVPLDRSLVIQLISSDTMIEAERQRLQDALDRADERVRWENAKADSWTSELARGRRTRGDAS